MINDKRYVTHDFDGHNYCTVPLLQTLDHLNALHKICHLSGRILFMVFDNIGLNGLHVSP